MNFLFKTIGRSIITPAAGQSSAAVQSAAVMHGHRFPSLAAAGKWVGVTAFLLGTTAYYRPHRHPLLADHVSYPSTILRRLLSGSRCLAHCCGIVAYVGPKDAEPILTEGVRILQNRGYDSCGMATINAEGELVTTKYASSLTTSDCVELLAKQAPQRHGGHHVGIAHTRWATHGGKTDINAHPHSDYKNRVTLVHNGTISNYHLLKKNLMDNHIEFKSDTDTEVIAHLVGWQLDLGLGLEAAVSEAVGVLLGTWGLVVMHKDYRDQIVCARNGSPMLIGCSDNEVFVASEAAALARHTNQFISLRDKEICVVSRHGISRLTSTRDSHRIHMEAIETSPAPYLNWTIKEISEQPQSLSRALNFGGRISPICHQVKLGGLDENRDSILAIRHLLIAGCGTSLHAGFYGEKLMQVLGCFDTSRSIDASELDVNAFPAHHGGLLAISQSGETLDTIRACQVAQDRNIKIVSVVNAVGSQLARLASCGVYLNAGREVAVASTKAFTSQVLVLALIATWVAQQRKVAQEKCLTLMDAVHRVPVYAAMILDCQAQCRAIAQKIKDAKTLFVLGKGLSYPVALEGALKIKEISYVHAEGFPGGALKHGPFALLDDLERTPVILVLPTDEHTSLMINAAEQIKARGAHLLAIVDSLDTLPASLDVQDQIVVPGNGLMTALLCVIPLQLLAYELAMARGIDPDKPRGLAKTVTVS